MSSISSINTECHCPCEDITNDMGFLTCTQCGKVQSYEYDRKLYYQRDDSFKEVINGKTYTHEVRFKKLLSRLFLTSSPPPLAIFEYLADLDLKTVADIRCALKKSKFKNKHYEYLSFFARDLLDYKITPLAHQEYLEFVRFFREVSFWCIQEHMKFFAFPYSFILRKIMKIAGYDEILPFINTLKCKKRIQRYDLVFSMHLVYFSAINVFLQELHKKPYIDL